MQPIFDARILQNSLSAQLRWKGLIAHLSRTNVVCEPISTHTKSIYESPLIEKSHLLVAIVNDDDIARPWCRATIIYRIVYPDPQNLRWGLKEVESDCYLIFLAGRPHIPNISYTNISMKQGFFREGSTQGLWMEGKNFRWMSPYSLSKFMINQEEDPVKDDDRKVATSLHLADTRIKSRTGYESKMDSC